MKDRPDLGRRMTVCALAITLAGGLGLATASMAVPADAPSNGKLRAMSSAKRVPGQFIVVYDDQALSAAVPGSQGMGAAMSAMHSHSATIAARHGGVVTQHYDHAIKGMVIKGLNDQQAARLAEEPTVAYVEADQTVSINATQNNATWGLDRIDQLDLPLDSTYTYTVNGSGVNAYVIDTGINISHNDFGGRAQSGYTAINDGRGSSDCNGHGTHVAGTVGSTTWGVAKGVTLYAVRVLDCNGSGSNSGVIAGVDWVAANAQAPAVANMSLGGGASSALDDAVASAVSNGITMVVAAGNENQNACNVSPSREPSAVTVGSSTSNDGRSSFSNYGTCVDIFAPGSSITSTWHTSNSATNTISGTSMASPHVAGAAALYLAEDPSASPAVVTDALVAAAAQGKLSSIGSGSPNLLLNIDFGGGSEPPPPPPGDTELANGDSVGSLSGSTGDWQYFFIDVPSGASNLSVNMSGGSGDADLYTRFGSKPTTSSYACRPYKNGNNETCTEASPSAGTHWIGIRAYSSYSGVNLSVSFDEPSTPPPSGDTELMNGDSVGNLSGASGDWQYFYIDVPAGATDFTVSMSGGSGDGDLYTRFGSKPTTSSYDCRPYRSGNNETCTEASPAAGTHWIGIRGYSSYSGVTLSVSYTSSGGGGGGPAGGGEVTGLSGSSGQWRHYTLDVPSGMSELVVDIFGGSGDADLYVRYGAQPSTSTYDCRPYEVGNEENCTFSNPAAGTWHISIRGYSSYSGVTLQAYYYD